MRTFFFTLQVIKKSREKWLAQPLIYKSKVSEVLKQNMLKNEATDFPPSA